MTLVSDQFIDIQINPPRLIGGRSRLSGEIKFPMPMLSDQFDPVHLKREGTLWAYTVQRFPPGRPFVGVTDKAAFKPFGVGYVELEGEVIVETRIVTEDFASLELGMPMTLMLEEFERGDGTGGVTTYAFQPSREVTS
ncbi:MAG: OB-fold domain-containing protein [Maricaulaceae bacterium]